MKQFIRRLIWRMRGEQDLEKLKKRGLKVGKNLHNMGEVIIDAAHCWHITIGDNVGLASRVQIIAHDASTKPLLGYTRVANVSIGNNVFVGAGTIILPGVTIGNNVIIGAGSVVSKDIPDNSVAIGRPAKVIKSIDEYSDAEKKKMLKDNVFGEEYTLRNPKFGEKERNELLAACEKYGQIFVE